MLTPYLIFIRYIKYKTLYYTNTYIFLLQWNVYVTLGHREAHFNGEWLNYFGAKNIDTHLSTLVS